MARKTKAQIMLEQDEKKKADEKKNAATTELYLHCRGHATMALSKLHGNGFDGEAALERLSRSVDRIHNNDTNEIEAMLMTQAKSLEYLFYDALGKLPSSNMEHAEVFASIALKAQSGCRKTLMALAELKYPRTTTIIKQQNNVITQQVNNNVKSEAYEIENNKKIANELNAKVAYEAKNMDIGTTITTGTANTPAEAVEVFNGS
ncbi:hypothetical protein [Fluoribacter gormanii]|uniref:Uncharacterized protein n=1 Tax=Fluoribacter gormanii TaxID=464 RepID=A0A377GKX3_9GAMM|nr:hypothetical protein [Fluoribacter gormanii]KTD00845.1 hypothetical protein Lgor_2762 [Fluoribacter gormanii]SIQ79812.1 hypothetical protein SAMN05421777_103102 [Fluoribacter gormanii]STO24992.1 Uncharacterised protein [Fluoribacter gormanii]